MSELIIKKRQAVFVFRVEDIVYMEKNLRKIRLHAKMCGCEKYEQIEFYGRFSEIISQLDDRFMYWMRGREIFILPDIRIYMGKDAYGRARRVFEQYLNKKYPEKALKNAKFFL